MQSWWGIFTGSNESNSSEQTALRAELAGVTCFVSVVFLFSFFVFCYKSCLNPLGMFADIFFNNCRVLTSMKLKWFANNYLSLSIRGTNVWNCSFSLIVFVLKIKWELFSISPKSSLCSNWKCSPNRGFTLYLFAILSKQSTGRRQRTNISIQTEAARKNSP